MSAQLETIRRLSAAPDGLLIVEFEVEDMGDGEFYVGRVMRPFGSPLHRSEGFYIDETGRAVLTASASAF